MGSNFSATMQQRINQIGSLTKYGCLTDPT